MLLDVSRRISLKSVLLLSFLSLTAQAETPADPLFSLFCKAETYGDTSHIAVVPSNASLGYFAPEVEFTDEKAQRFQNIYDYLPYSGDDLRAQLLLGAVNSTGQASVYRARAHIGRRTGSAEILSPSRELPRFILQGLNYRGLPASLMARKENTLVYAGAAAGEFVIYDITTDISRRVYLQDNLANPRFSVVGDYLIFDAVDFKTIQFKQVVYDLNTFKVAFTTPTSKMDALSLEYNPLRKNWVWLDYDQTRKAGTLVESSGSSKNKIITLSGTFSLPLVYFLNNGGLEVLWTELVYTRGALAQGRRPNLFTTAEARAVSLETGAIHESKWPMPKLLQDYLSDELPQRLLSGGITLPGTDKVYFSLDNKHGLAILNIKTGTWSLSSTFYPCVDPRPLAIQGPK